MSEAFPEINDSTPAMGLPKAVVLLSGGLDSATCLAIAASEGFDLYAMSFAYGQRHQAELKCAQRLAKLYEVSSHRVIDLNIGQIGGSSLTDLSMDVPEQLEDDIPNTYVPARNTIFLSIALGWAEVLQAEAIYVGVNALDYSGYPDCRPAFIDAFQQLANVATAVGLSGTGPKIRAPLLHLTKAEIIKKGVGLGLDYAGTVSCYQLDEALKACGKCASCLLRQAGFAAAGVKDPALA